MCYVCISYISHLSRVLEIKRNIIHLKKEINDEYFKKDFELDSEIKELYDESALYNSSGYNYYDLLYRYKTLIGLLKEIKTLNN